MFNFDRNKKKDVDPGSKDIWELFRRSEMDWCCKVIAKLPAQARSVTVTFPNEGTVSMCIMFCPKCGRRIE